MNYLLKLIFLSGSCLLAAGCATAPAPHAPAAKYGPYAHTQTYANGTIATGAVLNGQWKGPVELTAPNGTKCKGEYVNNLQDGLWKCHNTLNDLTSYTLYSAGKVLKSFSDMEQLWATGNYEEAYRIRGKKSLLGINLKKPENTSEIIADVVQIHSPAFISGFQSGDVIVTFDGTPVLDVESFIKQIVAAPFGQTVRVEILRAGKKMTLSVVPATIPRNFTGPDGRPVTSSTDRLWAYYRNLDSAAGYAKYIEFVTDPTYKAVASTQLQAALQREKTWLQSVINSGDMVQLAGYLEQYPASPLRSEAIDGANGILQKSKLKAPAYLGFVGRCPTCADMLPAEYGILAIGPAGMTVADLLRLSEQGIGADVIAAKIEGSTAEYKDFTFKEITFLSTLNVPSSVISAMIRSTHANAGKKLQEQNRKLQEENVQLKKQAAEQGSAQQKSAAANSAAADDDCLKLNLALAACDQGSGLLRAGCRIIAQSTFNCPSPGYR